MQRRGRSFDSRGAHANYQPDLVFMITDSIGMNSITCSSIVDVLTRIAANLLRLIINVGIFVSIYLGTLKEHAVELH